MKSPTLTDVARRAGVSYATADRVVNNRGRVSAKSAGKVQAAVEALEYVRNIAAANLSQSRRYRFVFVLPEGPNAFFGIIREQLRRHVSAAQNVEIHDVSAFDADGLSRHLLSLTKEQLDGVAVVGLDTEALAEPLALFHASGTPVVALVSDLPQAHRAAYIGIDNMAAGRTAARLLGQAHGGQAGLVQIIVGDLAARDHHDRHAGFQSVLKSDFPHIAVQQVVQSSDYADRVETEVNRILGSTTKVTAIYNAGAGNSGLLRALHDRTQRPLVAAHELTSHARSALINGTFDYIIDQRPEAEVDTALALMRAFADGGPPPISPPILPTIYVRDNLPFMPPKGCDPQ